MYDSDVVTDAGRAFQARTVATGNARSPSVVRHVVGTSSVDVDVGGCNELMNSFVAFRLIVAVLHFFFVAAECNDVGWIAVQCSAMLTCECETDR